MMYSNTEKEKIMHNTVNIYCTYVKGVLETYLQQTHNTHYRIDT